MTTETLPRSPRNDWVDLSSDQSVHKIDDAIREKWERSFGGDFWHNIYPIMCLVRPHGGPRWEHWMTEFELARAETTELDRRAALFTLINEYNEMLTDPVAQETVINRLMSLPEWGPVIARSPTIDITEPRALEDQSFIEMLEREAEREANAVDFDDYDDVKVEWWKD